MRMHEFVSRVSRFLKSPSFPLCQTGNERGIFELASWREKASQSVLLRISEVRQK
jgi:hypothetical protein